MSNAQYDEKRPAGDPPSPLRPLIGAAAIALFFALAAFGAGEPSGDVAWAEKGENAVASAQRSVNAPVYDGRGKWSGY
ncbi:MAG: hypothetical protein QNJ94_21825 [Alphaproteobacteria bacterium]|nr:hypothetical protein [Alphaproteobacteria bacterium]